VEGAATHDRDRRQPAEDTADEDHHGWQPSELLPENWRTKRTTEPLGEVKTQFLSDQGDLIKSYLAAMTHMEKTVVYGQDDTSTSC
jgi:hypothetical protein